MVAVIEDIDITKHTWVNILAIIACDVIPPPLINNSPEVQEKFEAESRTFYARPDWIMYSAARSQ